MSLTNASSPAIMPFPFADTRFLDWHSQGCPPRNREVKKGQRLLPGGSRTIASSSRSVGPTVGRACSCRSLERAEAIDPQPHPRFLPNFPRPVKRRKGKAASCGERGPRDKRRGGLFPLYEGKGKKSCIWRDRLDDAIIGRKKKTREPRRDDRRKPRVGEVERSRQCRSRFVSPASAHPAGRNSGRYLGSHSGGGGGDDGFGSDWLPLCRRRGRAWLCQIFMAPP